MRVFRVGNLIVNDKELVKFSIKPKAYNGQDVYEWKARDGYLVQSINKTDYDNWDEFRKEDTREDAD